MEDDGYYEMVKEDYDEMLEEEYDEFVPHYDGQIDFEAWRCLGRAFSHHFEAWGFLGRPFWPL